MGIRAMSIRRGSHGPGSHDPGSHGLVRGGLRGAALACGLAGGAAVALAACGGSGPVSAPASASASGSAGSAGGSSGSTSNRSAATIISQMKTAVRAAGSTHLDGRLSDSGRAVALDIGVFRSGDLSGTITQNGVPLRLVGSKGKVYVKATPAFLRQLKAPAAVCTILCGKYVQMSGPQANDLSGSLSMNNLTHSLLGGLPTFTKAGTTTVAGKPAIVLHGSDGSTLDVAARGKPYPLRIAAPPARHETVLFSEWDAVPAPAPPPANQVINLNQLKAGSS